MLSASSIELLNGIITCNEIDSLDLFIIGTVILTPFHIISNVTKYYHIYLRDHNFLLALAEIILRDPLIFRPL